METKFIAKDGTEFIVRELRKSDTKQLLDMLNKIIVEKPPGWPRRDKKLKFKQEASWVKENLKARKQKEGAMFVAEEKGKIVGWAHLGRTWSSIDYDHFRVLNILLLKHARGKGLGTFLIKQMIKFVKQKMPKVKIIELSVFSTNPRALNLYKRLGFRKVATIPQRVKRGNKYFDEIYMQRHI